MKLMLVFICLLLFSCVKNDKNSASSNTNAITDTISDKNEKNTDIKLYPQEEKDFGGGIYRNAYIIDDNVNIRSLPSLTGKVISKLNKDTKIKVIGISPYIQFIDNHNGYWINIALPVLGTAFLPNASYLPA